jgi:putative endonuclease
MYFVYIIECTNGSYYTGITTDVERRYQEHCTGRPKGAKYTQANKPVRIVYIESCTNRSSACIRETVIKKFSRKEKMQLLKEYASKVV